jgi:hypothetical protein
MLFLASLTLPKWMENNPKPKQMQQSNPYPMVGFVA